MQREAACRAHKRHKSRLNAGGALTAAAKPPILLPMDSAVPLPSDEITLEAALLRRGFFAAAPKQLLPWQAYCPPHAARGTVILLNEWGEAFTANAALLTALAARNFAALSYSWHLAPQQSQAKKGRCSAGFNAAALAAFLRQIALPDYPAPFYLLAQGSGALFALSARPLLSGAVSRMIAIAPAFSAGGHRLHGLGHWAAKALSLLSAASYESKAQARASFAWRAAALAAAASIFSPHHRRLMTLPCLIISAAGDSLFNRRAAARLAENSRLADIITLPGGPDFLRRGPARAQQQFWAGFDAFIPGSETMAAAENLENAALL